MLTRADHPKPEKLYFKAKLSTMQVSPVAEPELPQESNDNSNRKFDSPIQLGNRVTKYYYNGELEADYINPVIVNGVDDWIDLLDEITSTKSTISITTIDEDWDDIPSPTQEELDRAIAICDRYEFPDPVVPKTQETGQPSWD